MSTNKDIYLLSNTHYEGVNNLPLIKINFLNAKINFDIYEALIFSSKNAVKAVARLNASWKILPSYCIGEGTAKEVKNLGGKVEYVSKKSYGNEFAKNIAKRLEGKQVLFLRAKQVLSHLEEILISLHVKLDSQIIYETECSDMLQESPKKGAIIIFTSPSTVKCFFKHFSWDSSYKAVCIGKVTAKFLPPNVQAYISEQQSIQKCIKLARNLE